MSSTLIRINPATGRPIAVLPPRNGRGNSVNYRNNRDESGFAWAALFPAIGSIVSSLPAMGVGSKAKRKEIQAKANADTQVLAMQNEGLAIQNEGLKLRGENEIQSEKEIQKIISIAGVVIVVIVVMVFALRK